MEQVLNHLGERLHDCVFCGLEKTEWISIPEEFVDTVIEFIKARNIYYMFFNNKVTLFTTGLQLDKSFSDGQI